MKFGGVIWWNSHPVYYRCNFTTAPFSPAQYQKSNILDGSIWKGILCSKINLFEVFFSPRPSFKQKYVENFFFLLKYNKSNRKKKKTTSLLLLLPLLFQNVQFIWKANSKNGILSFEMVHLWFPSGSWRWLKCHWGLEY